MGGEVTSREEGERKDNVLGEGRDEPSGGNESEGGREVVRGDREVLDWPQVSRFDLYLL